MKLKWSETATRDLISIRRYIAADNPTAAKNWIERLRAKATHLAILLAQQLIGVREEI